VTNSKVMADELGRPIINFNRQGPIFIAGGGVTFGHEQKHLEDFMKGASVSRGPCREGGQDLWRKVSSELKRRANE